VLTSDGTRIAIFYTKLCNRLLRDVAQPAQLALPMVSSIAVWTSAGRSMCGMCPAPSSR